MSFLDVLEIEKEEIYDFEDLLISEITMGMRCCKWIRINDELALSIQASNIHYCIPRKLIELDKYTHFEMAIIINNTISYDTSVLKGFSKYNELMEYYQGGIFAYVDKELLEELYTYCKENL